MSTPNTTITITKDTMKMDDAIRTVLLERVTSDKAKTVLAEAKAALAQLDNQHDQVRKAALDPRAAAIDAAQARKEAEEINFGRERLTIAVDELTRRHAELRQLEQRDAAAIEYGAAKAERDALAQDLVARWPVLVTELVGLLDRIGASDRRLSTANTLNAGSYLHSAEAVARGCALNFQWGSLPVSRLTDLRIPEFGAYGWTWPKGAH